VVTGYAPFSRSQAHLPHVLTAQLPLKLSSLFFLDLVLKRYNIAVRVRLSIIFLILLAVFSFAQDADKAASDRAASDKAASDKAASEKAAARNREAEESSSRDTRVDISPPKDDSKSHPASGAAVSDLEADAVDNSGVQEFHPWNPLKAMKDVEVGDFYFKRKNYKAAVERYKEALYYKDSDAVASFRLAVCEEKLGAKAEAKKYYAQYLKILPEGPFAKDAHASLDRLAKAQ
jgi:tetratricopeptide (TPR) repeat protein